MNYTAEQAREAIQNLREYKRRWGSLPVNKARIPGDVYDADIARALKENKPFEYPDIPPGILV